MKWFAADQIVNQPESRTVIWTQSPGLSLLWHFWVCSQAQPSKGDCQQVALKEASAPGLLSWKVHLRKIWELWTCDVTVTDVTKRFSKQSWQCPISMCYWCCAIPQPVTGAGNSSEECETLLCLFWNYTQGFGLAWFCAACTEVNNKLIFSKLFTDSKNQGKIFISQFLMCGNKK